MMGNSSSRLLPLARSQRLEVRDPSARFRAVALERGRAVIYKGEQLQVPKHDRAGIAGARDCRFSLGPTVTSSCRYKRASEQTNAAETEPR